MAPCAKAVNLVSHYWEVVQGFVVVVVVVVAVAGAGGVLVGSAFCVHVVSHLE